MLLGMRDWNGKNTCSYKNRHELGEKVVFYMRFLCRGVRGRAGGRPCDVEEDGWC